MSTAWQAPNAAGVSLASTSYPRKPHFEEASAAWECMFVSCASMLVAEFTSAKDAVALHSILGRMRSQAQADFIGSTPATDAMFTITRRPCSSAQGSKSTGQQCHQASFAHSVSNSTGSVAVTMGAAIRKCGVQHLLLLNHLGRYQPVRQHVHSVAGPSTSGADCICEERMSLLACRDLEQYHPE